MATTTTRSRYSLVIVLVVMAIFSTITLASGFRIGYKSPDVMEYSPMMIQSRKLVAELKRELRDRKSGGRRRGEIMESRELEAVPSGPDPMHHYGGSPRKPRISP